MLANGGDNDDETMSLKEAARRMGVSSPTARRAARRGDIPAILWGRTFRVLKAPFDDLMRGRSTIRRSKAR